MNANEPIQPQRRELEIIRVLFDRRLADRAMALAETRWPGSGKMVELAYEWPNLSPGERRQRLSDLGPEQTHRLRALATLHPELEQAVNEMERRGVFSELQDAALDRVVPDQRGQSEAQVSASESTTQAETETMPADVSETAPAPQPDRPQGAPQEVDTESIARDFDLDVEQLQVNMPVLDLGLPSTSQFLEEQSGRHEEAMQRAQTMMDRVHQRLNQSADRIMSRSSSMHGRPRSEVAARERVDQTTIGDQLGTGAVGNDREPAQLPDPDESSRLIEAPATLTEQLRESRVVSLNDASEVPSDDELVALANELNLGVQEFEIGPGRLRELFGGLQRRGSSIETVAGPLPSALAGANLVLVRGRIHPKIVERMRGGWADIPGTRATVKMHDRARLLLAP